MIVKTYEEMFGQKLTIKDLDKAYRIMYNELTFLKGEH